MLVEQLPNGRKRLHLKGKNLIEFFFRNENIYPICFSSRRY